MLTVAALLTFLLAVATLLPFLPLAHGIVRVGDFPRQQLLGIAALLFAAVLLLGDGWISTLLLAVLLAVCVIQFWFILPFTRLWRSQSRQYEAAVDGQGVGLRILACNVKMSNRRYGELAATVEANRPDLLVLMEVDERWLAELHGLLAGYPHLVRKPQDNAYGLLLASIFPLSDTVVEDLLTDGVPSIVTTVEPQGGNRFRLYVIHPEPPVPHRGSAGRDGETALAALKVRQEELPVIVTGDLNDVAWSRTTERFRRISRLLDPRVGRTIFSTFDARIPLVRWPLDHLFHSPEFRLKAMRRLPPCGSDHFPVLFDLVLCDRPAANSEPKQASREDIRRAEELAEKARRRHEEPIGANWEN